MKARFRQLLARLSDSFWLIPAAMVTGAIALALGLTEADRENLVPAWLIDSPWLYNGGATGARTLLGAVASSSVNVAGTVFSITIAALSLAAGQMGPRLLRNFTRDRGVQFTLGAFLGTFSYALMVLRSVRTQQEGAFIPHLALSIGILLAFLCVGTLVFFVAHMASRINVDTVVDLVSADMRTAIARLTETEGSVTPPPPETIWSGACQIRDDRRGYLQHLDCDSLADWAQDKRVQLRLLVRPGSSLFPGAPIALVTPDHADAGNAIRSATATGAERTSADDLEYSTRQLVEVAVRALSPGINDPHTAISVLDRLGSALCEIAPRHLWNGVAARDGKPVLVVPAITYGGLLDTMFHMIRQNAATSSAVLIRMLEILTATASCENDPIRRAELRRHAGLVLADAERADWNSSDLDDARARHAAFMKQCGTHGHPTHGADTP